MTISLRTSLNTGLNSGLRQSISGGAGAKSFTGSTLDLDFAGAKSLKNQIGRQDVVSFTRASSATYVDGDGVIQSATTNTPRFDHDPATGESLGLLIEEARTNEWLGSEDVAGYSARVSVSVASNNAIAPDGTSTADTVTFAGIDYNWSIFYQGPYIGTYTWSGWLKTNDGSTQDIYLTWGAPDAARVHTFTVTGEWQRFSAVVTPANENVHLGNQNTLTPASWNGGVIDVWGVQLEEGSFATSYIPTEGTTVTRAADVAEITGANFSSFYNQSEGAVFVEAKASGTSAVVGFDDGTTAERWRVGYAGSNNSSIVVVDGGVVQTNINTSSNSTPYNQFHKLAGAIAANNLSFAHNGTLSSDSSVSVPVVNALSLGTSIDVSGHINGHIKRLAYFPTRLLDATLQNITT